MSRREFVKYLASHNCILLREGGEHSIYQNQKNGKTAAVPRHMELARLTVRGICDRLEIPRLAGS